jgi:hypothetical protein
MITRKSILSGKVRSKDIDVTPEQLERWMNGELIQKVMPHLSVDDRDFIINGIADGEFEEAFPNEDD